MAKREKPLHLEIWGSRDGGATFVLLETIEEGSCFHHTGLFQHDEFIYQFRRPQKPRSRKTKIRRQAAKQKMT